MPPVRAPASFGRWGWSSPWRSGSRFPPSMIYSRFAVADQRARRPGDCDRRRLGGKVVGEISDETDCEYTVYFSTVAGLVLDRLRRVPQPGDEVESEGRRVTLETASLLRCSRGRPTCAETGARSAGVPAPARPAMKPDLCFHPTTVAGDESLARQESSAHRSRTRGPAGRSTEGALGTSSGLIPWVMCCRSSGSSPRSSF